MEVRLGLAEQREQQPVPVAEPPEQCALSDTDPGRLRDLVHRHVLGAPLGDQSRGGLQQPDPVAGGVGAFGGVAVGCCGHGQTPLSIARTRTSS
ncbi:hypothetical protein [Streptomyces hokutonensis]|uniref:hypothetical protein n=1 Tax=Streptomyces hokutonensis TaxID=1306990 RepID=UPI00382B0256